MKNQTSPSNIGVVVSVRGSVVDIRFDAHLPAKPEVMGDGTATLRALIHEFFSSRFSGRAPNPLRARM